MPLNQQRSLVLPFPDRRVAGRALARLLVDCLSDGNPVVVAVTEGGVPVGREIAHELAAPMAFLPVVEIQHPGNRGSILGAVADGGAVHWNHDVLRRYGLSQLQQEIAIENSLCKLESLRLRCCGGRPAPRFTAPCVILVDDGMMSGAMMQAAVQAVNRQSSARIIVAVPVAHPDSVAAIRHHVDDVIYCAAPEPFYSVSDWYLDYRPVADTTVNASLDAAREDDPAWHR